MATGWQSYLSNHEKECTDKGGVLDKNKRCVVKKTPKVRAPRQPRLTKHEKYLIRQHDCESMGDDYEFTAAGRCKKTKAAKTMYRRSRYVSSKGRGIKPRESVRLRRNAAARKRRANSVTIAAYKAPRSCKNGRMRSGKCRSKPCKDGFNDDGDCYRLNQKSLEIANYAHADSK